MHREPLWRLQKCCRNHLGARSTSAHARTTAPTPTAPLPITSARALMTSSARRWSYICMVPPRMNPPPLPQGGVHQHNAGTPEWPPPPIDLTSPSYQYHEFSESMHRFRNLRLRKEWMWMLWRKGERGRHEGKAFGAPVGCRHQQRYKWDVVVAAIGQ